jgi:hypothetical protein
MRLRMSTLATLFEALTAARRLGVDFDNAWQAATAQALGSSCDPADWSGVLQATEDCWRRAYDGLPASRCERALSLIVEDMERADGDGDVCRRCSGLIPPERGRRARAVFCSDACRREWHRQQERVAA